MKRTASQPLQPVMSLPPPPLCLIRDEIELPDRYQPCDWAGDLIAERRAEERLAAVGAYPTLSALLVGPSGVGKTTASRWIAKQLKMPVFSLLLSGAIDSYLGSTGKSIESAVRYAMTVPCVLVLDELDAAIRRRFELEVSVPLPSVKELSNIAGVPVPDECRMSQAEMRRAVLQARRQSVLRGADYQLTLMTIIERGK